MASMQETREIVLKALAEVEELPASTREVLVEGVPHLSPVYGTAQSVIQAEVTRLARDALSGAQRLALDGLTTCDAEITAAVSEQDARRSTCLEADTAHGAAMAEAAAKSKELAAATAAVAEGEADCVGAERDRSALARSRAELQEERARLTAVFDGSVRMLREGGWDDEELMDASLQAVLQYLREADAEKALVASAAIALKLKPEARGVFDSVAIESVVELFDARVAGIDASLAAGEAEMMEASTEALGAWAIADVARDGERAARAAAASAESRLQAVATFQKDAWAAVVACETARDAAMSRRTLADARLREADLVLAALERLAVGAPEPQPVMEVNAQAVTEDIAMEQAEASAEASMDTPGLAEAPDVVMGEEVSAKVPVFEEVGRDVAAQMGA